MMIGNVKRRVLLGLGALVMSVGAFSPNAKLFSEEPSFGVQTGYSKKEVGYNSWKRFHAISGKCAVTLPGSPEHITQYMQMPEMNYNMKYDVYISPHEKKAVYMMLVAEYPPFINEDHSKESLENFLNGILMQNPNNKLKFADLVDVQGHKGLDFFIETQGVYFVGRVVMANNYLYLLAMECETKHYQEGSYKYFVSSFELLKK